MTDYQSKALIHIKGHLHKIYESDDEPLYVTEEDAIKAIEIALSDVVSKLDMCKSYTIDMFKTREQIKEMVKELYQERTSYDRQF